MNIDTTKKIVVFDADIPQLMENKMFDPTLAKTVSHTLLAGCYLYQEALKKGIQLVTPDIFLALPEKPSHAPMISNLTTPFTKQLIAAGAVPTILACGESPFIATRFYVGLKRISALFAHSFVFKGMRKRLSEKTVYHQMFFPESFDINLFAPLPFKEKKFLAMVSSNKRINNWKKNIILKLLYGFDVTEIYDKRLSLIKYFAGHEFDLFGFGWDTSKRAGVALSYRGTVDDKHETLTHYKFAFCLENSVFPGYITEKIFDAMFAGCIPVYCGAPDIGEYVPKNTFIDLRDFKTWKALEAFLQGMGEAEYALYMENIAAFFRSEQYAQFTQERYAEEVLAILEETFNHHA